MRGCNKRSRALVTSSPVPILSRISKVEDNSRMETTEGAWPFQVTEHEGRFLIIEIGRISQGIKEAN